MCAVSLFSDSPAGSFWSIAGTSLFQGCGILLALLLATLLGGVGKVDALLTAWMEDVMGETFAHSLPAAIPWLLAIAIAFGMPALLLNCRQGWQRVTAWFASIIIIGLWAPVLCLASHRPEISLVWLAAAVSGLLVTIHLYLMARKAS